MTLCNFISCILKYSCQTLITRCVRVDGGIAKYLVSRNSREKETPQDHRQLTVSFSRVMVCVFWGEKSAERVTFLLLKLLSQYDTKLL